MSLPLTARRVGLGVGLGLVVVVAMMVWADVSALVEVLGAFDARVVPAVLGLSLVGYAIRAAKWELYLRRLEISLPPLMSVLCFVAGMVMAITPGKVGEVLKSFLLREARGVSVVRTAPVVIAERLTDLLALLLLATWGVVASGHGVVVLALGTAVTVGLVVLLAWPAAWRVGIELAERLPLLGRLAPRLHEARDSMTRLVGAKTLLLTTGLSIVAWGCEAVGTWLVLNAFPGAEAGLGVAVFVFAFSTVAGALSMLPGGLVATEGSMLVLLTVVFAVVPDEQTGTAATLVVRFATLWFGVGLGAMALAWFRQRYLAAPQYATQ